MNIPHTTILIQFLLGDVDENLPRISDNLLSLHARVRCEIFLDSRLRRQFSYPCG